jgi:diguanylate cyclase (GGDEF)-like protein
VEAAVMTVESESRADRRPRVAHSTAYVLGISVLLAALAGVIGLPFWHHPPRAEPALPWWALAIAFAATEACVLHVQVRRETRTVSLSEIPLVMGLFLASPLGLVVGRLIGGAAILICYRRSPPLKAAFNIALFAAETAVAVAVFDRLGHLVTNSGPASWLAAYVAAFTANALAITVVGAVIAIYEGARPRRMLLREAASQPASLLAVIVGLVAVTTLSASTDNLWLLVALGVVLLVGFRRYASLSERHQYLERLSQFSQAVGRATQIDEVMTNVLSEARQLLRAERASAAFVTADGEFVARVRLGPDPGMTRSEDPPTAADEAVMRRVLASGSPLLMPRTTRDPEARAWLDQYGMRDAVAVPLGGAAGITGVLTVADRLGDVRTFEHDDALLLDTVAHHAAVAMRNGELIGQLRHDALHDALTGLPNRVDLQRRLAAALDKVVAGEASGAAVMILDLDDFKAINDTLGHQQGDLLLVEVAARLRRAVGRAGTLARLGGDEFAVLVSDTADEDRVMHIGRRMVRALEHPITLDGMEVEIRASVGIALAPVHASQPADLLKRADMAMYDAKQSNRRLRLYEPDLNTNNPRRLMLVSELRTALQNNAIKVHVQPQARTATGTVVGGEALVRWNHPELGWISPDEFIPVAERSGLIAPLTIRMLDASLAACAQWRAAGHDLGIAVNLSTRSLYDTELVEEVARLLRRHGVPADRLTLEVTEGSVMADLDRAVALLHQLRELGVRLSVDDFGTGYSSLSYLKRLPVQEVKIDRSFVAGLGEHGEDAAIVRAIVDLAAILGLEVVAEGVEDQVTWDRLAEMGCDLVQGYYLARAMPTAELLPWLTNRTATPPTLRAIRAGQEVM